MNSRTSLDRRSPVNYIGDKVIQKLSDPFISELRTLTLTAQNLTGSANHCRAEAPEADADHDGLPDNTQPLYLARNGDPTQAEDPTRTYLYRNFYAAEARLGITDYSPTGTAANTPDNAANPMSQCLYC